MFSFGVYRKWRLCSLWKKMSRKLTKITLVSSDWTTGTPFFCRCIPTATGFAPSCTFLRSTCHHAFCRDCSSTFAVSYRRISGARRACCFGPCTQSVSPASSPCSHWRSSTRCRCAGISAGTWRTSFWRELCEKSDPDYWVGCVAAGIGWFGDVTE